MATETDSPSYTRCPPFARWFKAGIAVYALLAVAWVGEAVFNKPPPPRTCGCGYDLNVKSHGEWARSDPRNRWK